MFRNEKTVPNMSFASSSALKTGRDAADSPLGALDSEVGRVDLLEEVGLGSHRRL